MHLSQNLLRSRGEGGTCPKDRVTARDVQGTRAKRDNKEASERTITPCFCSPQPQQLSVILARRLLELRERSGRPLPLSWRRGTFRVLLEAGETTVHGHISEPFAAYRGSFRGPAPTGHVYSLVHRGQIAATLATYSQVRALAAELAPVLIRGDPPPDPGGVIDRHRRDAK
jgi:hypothetical protein